MSDRSFWDPQAQAEACSAVKAAEAQTSAEVVVALRRQSDWYRAADLSFGALVACAALGAVLVLPEHFGAWALPMDLALGFGLGALACSRSPRLRRLLTPATRRRESVAQAARAAFYALGVSRTSGRWGVLVYVSMLERDVEVVPDAGVDLLALGEAWGGAVEALRSAVAHSDFEAFKAAIEGLGAVLGKAHPHQEDDVNELPDEVSA